MTDVSAQPIVETHFPVGRDLTWEDLQTIPDEDYWRYELVDGSLLVSPGPELIHQRCAGKLFLLLTAACPEHLEVLFAPFDFTPETGFVLQPDVMVLDPERAERQRTHVAPLLAVEVLSPGTRTKDRVLKRAVYAEYGVASYWIVDPIVPSLLALELVGDAYNVVAEVRGEEAAALERPFPVTITPARLVDRSR